MDAESHHKLHLFDFSLLCVFKCVLKLVAFVCYVFSKVSSDNFQKFHVCGKNQTCVGIDNDHLNYHVCGFYHTCVDFTKYLRHVKVFGKNHTCVGKYKHVCVFQNTGW